jgi:hypothetical protein
MPSKKGFVIPLIIAIVAVLAISGGLYFYKFKTDNVCFDCGEKWFPPESYQSNPTTTDIVGGDKDIHGCIGSAGYSWCAVKNKCLRVWEEKCEITPIVPPISTSTDFIVCTMDAMMCPDGSYVGRSGPDCKFVCPK